LDPVRLDWLVFRDLAIVGFGKRQEAMST